MKTHDEIKGKWTFLLATWSDGHRNNIQKKLSIYTIEIWNHLNIAYFAHFYMFSIIYYSYEMLVTF